MGYWDEKQQYEARRARQIKDLAENMKKREFCNGCGRRLTKSNVKGMCTNCNEIICKICAKTQKRKIICSDCIEEDKLRDKRKWNINSILGFIFSFFGILSIVGLILSIIALKQTRDNKQRGRELAKAGLIISIIILSIILLAIIVGFVSLLVTLSRIR